MDMSDPLFQVAAAALFAYFAINVIEKTFDLVKGFAGGSSKKGTCAEAVTPCMQEVLKTAQETQGLVRELHKWHAVTDPRTGAMVWYSAFGTTDLKDTMAQLSETLRSVTEVLRNVVEQQKEEKDILTKVAADITELKRGR